MRVSKLRIFSIGLIIVICFFISYFYIVSHSALGKIYQEETRDTIVDIKKTFLKDTIDNLFTEIDIERESEYRKYKDIVEQRGISLDLASEDDQEFIMFLKNRFDMDINTLGKGNNYWTVLFWDNQSKEIIYDPLNEFENINEIDSVSRKLKPEFLSYKEVNHGNVSGIFGIKTSFVDDKIKLITAEKIRRQKFDNDAYIWVNEIINYEGGDNYAIRRVHPNLPETEGSFLSTSATDIKGNMPYLEELEGINKDGELFFTYFFKKLNSDEVAEKITYAKLYKDFDWIIIDDGFF